MPETTTYEMLRAAMIKAVEIKLVPRHSLLAEYLNSWERLEAVIQAALDGYNAVDTASCSKALKAPEARAGGKSKNRWQSSRGICATSAID